MSKKIFCIRHGQALHNVLFWEIGQKAYLKYRDTPLTAEGVKQSQLLGESYFTLGNNNIDLIIVSPLLRTLQTATNIFCKNLEDVPPCPMIALDCVMEYPQGLDKCNHRKSILELKYCFPKIDFSKIEYDEDPVWRKYEIEPIVSGIKIILYVYLSSFKDRRKRVRAVVTTIPDNSLLAIEG